MPRLDTAYLTRDEIRLALAVVRMPASAETILAAMDRLPGTDAAKMYAAIRYGELQAEVCYIRGSGCPTNHMTQIVVLHDDGTATIPRDVGAIRTDDPTESDLYGVSNEERCAILMHCHGARVTFAGSRDDRMLARSIGISLSAYRDVRRMIAGSSRPDREVTPQVILDLRHEGENVNHVQ